MTLHRVPFRQARLLAVLALALGLLFSFFRIHADYRHEREELDGEVLRSVGLVREAAAQAAYMVDAAIAQNVVNGLLAHPPVVRVSIVDDFGRTLGEGRRSVDPAAHRWLSDQLFGGRRSYTVPLTREADAGEPVGTLEVEVDPSIAAEGFFDRAVLTIAYNLALVTILSGLIFLAFYTSVARPLMAIATKLSDADPEHPKDLRLEPPSRRRTDEFALLVSAANRLLQSVDTRLREVRDKEQALRDSEARLSVIVNSAAALVFVKDLDGRYLFANHEFERLAGPEPIVGRTDAERFPVDGIQFRNTDRVVIETGEPQESEETVRWPNEVRSYFTRKVPLRDAQGAMYAICGVSTDITERKRTEDQLRLQERALDAISQGILVADPGQPDCPIIYVNRACARITGYTAAEACGSSVAELCNAAVDRALAEQAAAAFRDGAAFQREILKHRKDGTPFWCELSISGIRDADGKLLYSVGVIADVSQRRQLEAQLRQSQKMETVGQLTGGVAHDFNNLLTVVLGNAEFLSEDLPAGSRSRTAAETIAQAAGRAAELTHRLLAFSRRQVLQPVVIDCNALVRDTEAMLRRTIGEQIGIVLRLAEGLWPVRADPGELTASLMNLAVNARDAMPQGGQLTIETRNVELAGKDLAFEPELAAGDYVLLSVSDTGEGMSREVAERAFEPFFTTKEVGKGTGLGLSMVYGFVRQSGGHVRLYSDTGHGTTVKVYLPRAAAGAGSAASTEATPPASPVGGRERILVVEDDVLVREYVAAQVRALGYAVVEAADGPGALAILSSGAPVDLLFTDVVMPGGMSGRDLAEEARRVRPGVKVLLTSGYTADAVLQAAQVRDGLRLLSKPYRRQELAEAIRRALDGG